MSSAKRRAKRKIALMVRLDERVCRLAWYCKDYDQALASARALGIALHRKGLMPRALEAMHQARESSPW